jgi:hypothetical protein
MGLKCEQTCDYHKHYRYGRQTRGLDDDRNDRPQNCLNHFLSYYRDRSLLHVYRSILNQLLDLPPYNSLRSLDGNNDNFLWSIH